MLFSTKISLKVITGLKRKLLEAWVGIAPTCNSFAESCLTTWLPGHHYILLFSKQFVNFLPVFLSQVDGDIDERNIFCSHVFFEKFSKFRPFAFGEFERRLFFFEREDGDEDSRAF